MAKVGMASGSILMNPAECKVFIAEVSTVTADKARGEMPGT